MKIFDKKIILASKSPRRSQLLREAGFQFEIKTKEVEETFPPEMSIYEVAAFLAEKKAMAATSFIEKDEIILTADSIVIANDTIFGKPKDVADARRTLRILSGGVHEVMTGVCLYSKDKKLIFSDTSKVHFLELTSEEIDYYIEQFHPFDKAGSYGIQEWIGWCKIAKIEGSYSNIMGLPMQLVYQKLSQF